MLRYSSDQYSTSRAHSKQHESLNHDDVLQIALIWTLFETGSASVRSGAILSAYIYLCTGSNSTVGYVQGITGIAQVHTFSVVLQFCGAKKLCFNCCLLCCLQMVAALPAGWMADKYRRDYILKGAAALGAIAGASLAITLLYKLPVNVLFGACALLGTYTGFNNAPLEALFADCVPRGKRWGHLQAICLYPLTAMLSAQLS